MVRTKLFSLSNWIERNELNMIEENYQLYHGDCLDVMKQLIQQGVQVDMVLCDPPYGTSACAWDYPLPMDEMWNHLKQLIKPNGAIVLFGNEPFSSHLRLSQPKWYKYDWKWIKPNATTPSLAKIQPMRRYEDIMVFYQKQPNYHPQMTSGKPYQWNSKRSGGEASGIQFKEDRAINNTGTRYPTNILEFSQERGLHPTQKPVLLLEYLVKTYTKEGETVLDFTMGSGSTGVACMNTGRNFIGIELDDKYFNIAKERMETHMKPLF